MIIPMEHHEHYTSILFSNSYVIYFNHTCVVCLLRSKSGPKITENMIRFVIADQISHVEGKNHIHFSQDTETLVLPYREKYLLVLMLKSSKLQEQMCGSL